MGASATKSFARSRIFRYGLRNDILSRGQRTKARGGAGAAPMVLGVKNRRVMKILFCLFMPYKEVIFLLD